jgi:N-acetylglucosamine kinase-like BadF-type ATPase
VKLFAGIDGGQSSTIAVIGDGDGAILGIGRAGPADEIGAGKDSTRLRDALHGALEDAVRIAALPPTARFEAIVAGISGYDGQVYGQPPALPSDRVALVHDTPIAHAGALGGRGGVVVIAGTGSVVYGRNDAGWSCTLGGWGFLFGDEGSAFAIARDALAMLMRAQDENDSSLDDAIRSACDFFGATSLRALVHAFYKGEVTRDRLAAFAPLALRFDVFRSLGHRGAERLALLACRAISDGAPPLVALIGGVFGDAGMREHVRAGIIKTFPRAELVEAKYEPACGALLLAYRERGRNLRGLSR